MDYAKEFPSKYFPIFIVWGKELNIGGVRHIRGMVRKGMDAQRMINYWESKLTEVVALQPTAPFLGTPVQFAGHEDLYKSAAKGEPTYCLTYNPDPAAATPIPQRVQPPIIPTGMENRSAVNRDILKSNLGIHDSSVGAQSNEISGKGILARQHQSERGTFCYQDNLSRTLRTLGRVLLDMIPRIYDADRIVRILGLNGEVRRVRLDHRPEGYDPASLPPEERIYDPSVGRYDVSITVGPAYATRRQEAADIMSQMVQTAPLIAPIVLPRIAKMIDFPDADELAQDLEVMLPPELKAKREAERGEGEEGTGGQPVILGPDGQPVSSADMQAEAPAAGVEQPPVDPLLQSRAITEQAKAVAAVLDLREKYKALGYTDVQIDRLIQELEKSNSGNNSLEAA